MLHANVLDKHFEIPRSETYSALAPAIAARRLNVISVGGTSSVTHDEEIAPVIGSGLEEKLFDALANAKILTSRVAMHLDLKWRDRFFKMLDRIHDPAAWDDSDAPVTAESVKTFLRAMFLLKPYGSPAVGLSPRGTILSGWRNEAGDLNLDFTGRDMVTWSLIARRGDWNEPAAGITRIENLVQRLAPYPQRALFEQA